jgi:hypothetical protein
VKTAEVLLSESSFRGGRDARGIAIWFPSTRSKSSAVFVMNDSMAFSGTARPIYD